MYLYLHRVFSLCIYIYIYLYGYPNKLYLFPPVENESIDVVVDKGTLDAIYHTDSYETSRQASLLFDEISRCLSRDPGHCGRYLIVTLCQEFILKKIVSYFGLSLAWKLELHKIETDSPLLTFLVVVSTI